MINEKLTSDTTPLQRHDSIMKDIEPGHMPQTPGNPVHVTTFNLKNASPKFGMREGEGDIQKMYHNTAPPAI